MPYVFPIYKYKVKPKTTYKWSFFFWTPKSRVLYPQWNPFMCKTIYRDYPCHPISDPMTLIGLNHRQADKALYKCLGMKKSTKSTTNKASIKNQSKQYQNQSP